VVLPTPPLPLSAIFMKLTQLKDITTENTARQSRNQMQILRFAQNDMSS